jgi:pyruvate/2-oxoglutarate dehydrogenase complex dihydrolipoamide dehydrogenase (E3) component/uncharacterized membrane protein YdjX (TVP38/TMEM64 family)
MKSSTTATAPKPEQSKWGFKAQVVRFAPTIAIAAALTVLWSLGATDWFSLAGLEANYRGLEAAVERSFVLTALGYLTVYTVLTAVSIPGALFLTLAGGLMFGLWVGTLLTATGATIGAVLLFLAARTSFGASMSRWAGDTLVRFQVGFQRNAVQYLLFLRLVPIFPFWLVNLMSALLSVKLRDYVLATFLGILPGTFIYTGIGAGAAELLQRGESLSISTALSPLVWLPLVGLGLLSLATTFLRKSAEPADKATEDAAGTMNPAPAGESQADLCIIGGGAAGLSLAAGAAQMGAHTILVERDRMGGECLHTGCVPSKALIAAGQAAEAVRGRPALGISGAEPTIDSAGVFRHIRQVIGQIESHDSARRFQGFGVDVVPGTARFIGPGVVEVVLTAGGSRRISARRFAIATGTKPTLPPIPGLADGVPYLTNETVFQLAEIPAHLLIIGGGSIGCELAQALVRLGARVTVIESGRVLGREDAELAAPALVALTRAGVEMRAGQAISGLSHDAAGITVTGSHVLIAAGRTPTTAGLGLEVAGVAVVPDGIAVDRRLRTTNPRIFALGDVATIQRDTKGPTKGAMRFTHAAGYHAGIVIKNVLFRMPAKVDYRAMPRVTYTDPEIAQVGLTEVEAGDTAVKVLRWPFSGNDRAVAHGTTTGLVKVIVGKRGRILGVGIVGPSAGEQISLWQLAIARKLRIDAVAQTIAPYPTLVETSKRVAGSYYTDALFGPRTRRIVRALSRLG